MLTAREHPRIAKSPPAIAELQRAAAATSNENAAFARARGLMHERTAWWRNWLEANRPMARTALILVPATVVTLDPAVVLRLPNATALEVSTRRRVLPLRSRAS
jgi:hypothetical protein